MKNFIRNFKKKNLKPYFLFLKSIDAGFTLVELLVVIAIMTIIGVISFANITGYKDSQDIKGAGQQVAAILRDAQNRSVSGEGGGNWGVHFSNTTSTLPSYAVVSGTVYSSQNIFSQSVMPAGTLFTGLSPGSSLDIFFSSLTGRPASTTIITVGKNSSAKGGVSDILIKNSGQISSNYDSGLVGYWHLDEGSGVSTTDASGWGNNGTFSAAPTWQSGSNCKAGQCPLFNGTQYINVGANSSLTPKDITLEAWVNASSLPAWEGIISNMTSWGTGFSLQIGTTQKIAAMISGYYLTTSWTPSTGVWYHIAATHNGTTNQNILYVNGTQENQSTRAVTYEANAKTYIGVFYTIPSLLFNGTIDEVRIYNRVLSASEILSQYNALK